MAVDYNVKENVMSHGSRWIASALITLAAGTHFPAAAENLQGHAKAFTTRQIGLTQNGAPLLQSFYFKYTREDHHFSAIEIVPGKPATNQVSIGYTDDQRRHEYFYNITFAPYFGEIFRRSDGREHCIGQCTYPLQAPPDRQNYVFVLRGFYIYYLGDDHHIEQIKIEENNGLVTVALNDDDDDDRFRVDLHYAYIPRSRFLIPDGEWSGTSKGSHGMAIPGGTAVIRGFDFDIKGSRIDRHIRDIGVVLSKVGRLEVYFGDKEPTEQFDWKVQYAILRP